MDELLAERVKQLREIDERLERLWKSLTEFGRTAPVCPSGAIIDLSRLRNDLADMIREAERQHAAF